MTDPSPPPTTKQAAGCVAWGCGAVTVLAIGLAIMVGTTANPTSAPKPRVATVDKSPEKQAQRLKLIQEMIATGAISKIETGAMPSVYVRRVFYELDMDTKRDLLSIVYAYYFDGSSDRDMVRIKDARSGNRVGSFSSSGLILDEP